MAQETRSLDITADEAREIISALRTRSSSAARKDGARARETERICHRLLNILLATPSVPEASPDGR